MYTRFKSQKSGIKMGLNTITNKNPRIMSTNSDPTPKKTDLKSTTVLITNASVVLEDKLVVVANDPIDNSTISLLSIDKSEESPKNGNKNKKSKKEVIEESDIDPVGTSYVKSMWEKYLSEIGTESGPQRHVDETPHNYPHLNGFVAFDMEHWWAERSISSMLNEKIQPMDTKKNNTQYESTTRNNCFNLKLNTNTHASIYKSMQNTMVIC